MIYYILFYFILILVFPEFSEAHEASKISSNLYQLIQLKNSDQIEPGNGHWNQNSICVSIRFNEVLTNSQILDMEKNGVDFFRWNGQFLHVGQFYDAKIPWDKIHSISNQLNVARIETQWQSSLLPTLNLSREQVQAEAVWQILDDENLPLTGKGITIATNEFPPDIFHPAFFFADGGAFSWLDVNGNGKFDSGLDGVDLNQNEYLDENEILRFWDGIIEDKYNQFQNNLDLYDCNLDWLYNDANNNGNRDFGINSGFTESDPTYGEQIFIFYDQNKDFQLNTTERLIGLKTSKIKGCNLYDQKYIYLRGSNLIECQSSNQHSTLASGILSGGNRGYNLFAGIAPDAELLFFSETTITSMAWAVSMGADLISYQVGGYNDQFLDGSSNIEEAINFLAKEKIPQVVAAGNLAGLDKHMRAIINPKDSIQILIQVPKEINARSFHITILWYKSENDINFVAHTPGNIRIPILQNNISKVENILLSYRKEKSARGTTKAYLSFGKESQTVLDGLWILKVINNSLTFINIDAYAYDFVSGWSHGVHFMNLVSDDGTITLPGTADSAITVASYEMRGVKGIAGDLNSFSSRGKRIDGHSILDLAAPGSVIYTTARRDHNKNFFGGYSTFSGTSAATPFVAGAVALLLQANKNLSKNRIRSLLSQGAVSDQFTGSIPNDNWGAGKLRILNSLQIITDVHKKIPKNDSSGTKVNFLIQNFPNPLYLFKQDPKTVIEYYINKSEFVTIKIYNIIGQKIITLENGENPAGWHRIIWNAKDQFERIVPVGIYILHVVVGKNQESKKIVVTW